MTTNCPPIEALATASSATHYPITLQQRVLIGGAARATVQIFYTLEGALDIPAFRAALSDLMDRQWILKTKFVKETDGYSQVIAQPETEFFFQKDLQHVPPENLDEVIVKELEVCLDINWQLDKSPLLKSHLFSLGDNQYVLALSFNHLVFDALSMEIVRGEIEEFYAAKVAKRPPQLPKLSVQFADYALWEKKIFDEQKYRKTRGVLEQEPHEPADFKAEDGFSPK